jgi:sugar lactone lactonase YvrE
MLNRRRWLEATAAFAAAPQLRAAAPRSSSFTTVVQAEVYRMFRTPGPNPNGLQATTDGLWIYDQGTNRVALVRLDDGKVLREFATDTDKGSGITWDGTALWIASTYNRMLVRIDPRNGETLKKFESPGSGVVKWGPRSAHPQPTGAHGLEYRDGELYVANPPSATIYVMSPIDVKVLRSYPAPGVRPHGVGWDPDGSLWCTESIYRSFFKMDRKNGHISKQVMLPPLAPEVDGIVQAPHGMTVWNRQIWFSVAETGEVYRTSLPD